MVLLTWFMLARELLLHPGPFFHRLKEHTGLRDPLLFAVMSTTILGILRATTSIAFSGTDPVAAAGMIAAATVSGVISPVVAGGILHLFVFLVGGRGLAKTIQVMAYLHAVPVFYAWLPIVDIAPVMAIIGVYTAVMILYQVYLLVAGISLFHGISKLRALFAVLLPIIIPLIVAVAGAIVLTASPLPSTTGVPVPPIQDTGSSSDTTGLTGAITGACHGTPTFANTPLHITGAEFTDADTLALHLRSTGEFRLDAILLDIDRDGTADITHPVQKQFYLLDTATVTITSSTFLDKGCATIDLAAVRTTNAGKSTTVSGTGPLRRPIL